MSNKIYDGGLAFAGSRYEDSLPTPENDTKVLVTYPGMTLRDYFAAAVAQGMCSFSGTAGLHYGPGDIATRSYEVADAMLKAREARP